jgi:hypothetical protein
MKHATCFADEQLHLCESVVESGALVDDAVQSKFGGDFHLLPENFRLLFFVKSVIGCGEFRFLARQMVIVQTRFADGDDFGVFGKFAQGSTQVGWRVHCLGRMPTDGGIDARKFFGEIPAAFARATASGKSFA